MPPGDLQQMVNREFPKLRAFHTFATSPAVRVGGLLDFWFTAFRPSGGGPNPLQRRYGDAGQRAEEYEHGSHFGDAKLLGIFSAEAHLENIPATGKVLRDHVDHHEE